ncbi:hypothetical protein PROFUN_03374 [Planoprotostelium fungivorum]|uniref:Iron hydrogenase small subunit domain-containing protein n=1 Tax=Planoprotostelium fungivorum TaxID=1890364 RepID=A0A2P6NWC6_9EUKA|nr:hypothetical protein PROFUN_03374 [Planoprotostelium fungivorum]
MTFSGALKLTDLDDFITPSQACVKPEVIQKNQDKKARITFHPDGEVVEEEEDGNSKVLESAKITLNDCLACSGCVTSAETMLITAQSGAEFLSSLEKNKMEGNAKKIVVVSVSPQSRASLAAFYRMPIRQAYAKLITCLKSMGVDYVFDTSFSRDFALREAAAEFISRYRREYGEKDKELPMLASACPGWICLAEKSHGDFILPYISSTKSPQQIMGTIVKEYFAKQLDTTADRIYHVTVMPCYDKKLEASRDDFYNDVLSTRDVDCVLSSGEILDIIKGLGKPFSDYEESAIDSLFTNIRGEELFGVAGGSGGYIEYIFKRAARELFNKEVTEIQYQPSRNNDFKTLTLEVEGKKVLEFALAYGLRNIQNVVRKLKQNKDQNRYHFVEIMACPSGCINGGGQIRPQEGEDPKKLLKRVELLYNETMKKDPEDNEASEKLQRLWFDGVFTLDAKTKLHTQYHAREKMQTNALNIKW